MRYSSNAQQVILNIKGKLKKASDVSALQREVATYLRASNIKRIHNEGLAVNYTAIGQYDTINEMYVNPANAPRKFIPEGKTGEKIFKNGKKHKTKYFTSYSSFRSNQGRQAGQVNLELTGTLKRNWWMEQEGKDWVVGFLSQYGTEISKGQEAKWGKKIWGVSQRDLTEIQKIENEFVKKALA